VIKKLSTSEPYISLCQDLYSLDIFDKAINGLLTIIEKNKELRITLVERKFVNNSGSCINAGYFFIQCLKTICEEEHLKVFRRFLETTVKEKAKGNYMEVDPILSATGYSNNVIDFVDKYNEIQRRKPIQLFLYG